MRAEVNASPTVEVPCGSPRRAILAAELDAADRRSKLKRVRTGLRMLSPSQTSGLIAGSPLCREAGLIAGPFAQDRVN